MIARFINEYISMMATNSMLFTPYDARKDKISVYLERFDSHCKVFGIDNTKKVDLCVASLNNDAYEKIKISISPLKVSDLDWEKLQLILLDLSRPRSRPILEQKDFISMPCFNNQDNL